MSPATLVVDSVTGVDVALPVAGPGARAFAFLIDWHIRAILAIAWYVIAAVLYLRSFSLMPPLDPDAPWFIYVLLPPAAVYFLYHPVWELATRGRTPGKRMAGVELVDRNGGAPGIGPLLTRNVFRLIDSLPLFYAVGLVTTMVTRENLRIGDLAAGTLLVYVRCDATLPALPTERSAGVAFDTASAELVAELLERWAVLDATARRRLAKALLPASADFAQDDDGALRARLERLAAGTST
jgi:uncharacterized RDD family membrane protein YckC